MIYKNVARLIGQTPLMEMNNFKNEYKLNADIIAKLEFFNPAGSVKDRVGLAMIEEAEKEGRLKKGATIIEPTSGNTGIGLSAVATTKGYNVILTMPDTMSVERIKLLEAYGAKIVLTEGAKGMQGAIDKANELLKEIPDSILAGQFTNPANPKVHYETTGPEIWTDTEGKVDIFVAGVGTGGTITGVAKYLKEKNPDIKVVAIEPDDSPMLSEGKSGPHKIQGIGANFIPEVLDRELIDEVIRIKTDEAYEGARTAARKEGVLVGISSGATLWGAKVIAEREENRDKKIVVLLPDTGDRYLSTDLFG